MNKRKLKLRDKLRVHFYWVWFRYISIWYIKIQCYILAKRYGIDPIVIDFDDYWDYMMTEFYKINGLDYYEEKKKRGEES